MGGKEPPRLGCRQAGAEAPPRLGARFLLAGRRRRTRRSGAPGSRQAGSWRAHCRLCGSKQQMSLLQDPRLQDSPVTGPGPSCLTRTHRGRRRSLSQKLIPRRQGNEPEQLPVFTGGERAGLQVIQHRQPGQRTARICAQGCFERPLRPDPPLGAAVCLEFLPVRKVGNQCRRQDAQRSEHRNPGDGPVRDCRPEISPVHARSLAPGTDPAGGQSLL